MATKTIRQTVRFKVLPEQVYETLMNSRQHQALSGEPARISKRVGGKFTAWGPHISGFNLVLKPGRRIVQAWRAHDWPEDQYSIATFDIRKVKGGSELVFTQVGVPLHRYRGHSSGWRLYYWNPMREVFAHGERSRRTRATVDRARKWINRARG